MPVTPVAPEEGIRGVEHGRPPSDRRPRHELHSASRGRKPDPPAAVFERSAPAPAPGQSIQLSYAVSRSPYR